MDRFKVLRRALQRLPSINLADWLNGWWVLDLNQVHNIIPRETINFKSGRWIC